MVGIIGGGFISNIHAECYKKLGVKIAAIADIDENIRKEFAKKYRCKEYESAQKMLKDIANEITVVDICAPTFLHEEMVVLASGYKKHIICEKPLSINLTSVDNIINKVEESGKYLMTGHVLHFWPEYVKIKEWFDKGIFGNIKLVSATRFSEHPKSKWFYDPIKSGGGIFELHIHDVDFLCYMLGDVKEVYANGSKDENDSWDFVNSSITFKNGIPALAQCVFGITENYPFTANLKIIGDEATAEYSFSAGVNLGNESPKSNDLILYRKGKNPLVEILENRDPYEMEIEYFINCIKENKKPQIVNLQSVRKSTETITCLIKSLETGNVIKI